MTQRTFDRYPHPDERNRHYPIRTLLDNPEPRSYTWACNTWLDQGAEGACVGFAWAHENAAKPKVRPSDTNQARALYRRAQQLDQWPGEEYEGTSVLAGAKAMQESKLLVEYRWAFALPTTLAAISRHGPVVLGINWHEGMLEPINGMIAPTGEVVGGHAILAIGVSLKTQTVLLHNSWGKGWGINGRARIGFVDLAALLAADGDACVPATR